MGAWRETPKRNPPWVYFTFAAGVISRAESACRRVSGWSWPAKNFAAVFHLSRRNEGWEEETVPTEVGRAVTIADVLNVGFTGAARRNAKKKKEENKLYAANRGGTSDVPPFSGPASLIYPRRAISLERIASRFRGMSSGVGAG